MKPTELQEIAAAHVSHQLDDKGNRSLKISNELISLSPLHSGQFNELAGKVKGLKDQPEVVRLSKKAVAVRAPSLVAVLEAAAKQNVELEDLS